MGKKNSRRGAHLAGKRTARFEGENKRDREWYVPSDDEKDADFELGDGGRSDSASDDSMDVEEGGSSSKVGSSNERRRTQLWAAQSRSRKRAKSAPPPAITKPYLPVSPVFKQQRWARISWQYWVQYRKGVRGFDAIGAVAAQRSKRHHDPNDGRSRQREAAMEAAAFPQ